MWVRSFGLAGFGKCLGLITAAGYGSVHQRSGNEQNMHAQFLEGLSEHGKQIGGIEGCMTDVGCRICPQSTLALRHIRGTIRSQAHIFGWRLCSL